MSKIDTIKNFVVANKKAFAIVGGVAGVGAAAGGIYILNKHKKMVVEETAIQTEESTDQTDTPAED